MSLQEQVATLDIIFDLFGKLKRGTDTSNNVCMMFENRTLEHIGTFDTLDKRKQDWEFTTPYLGCTAKNELTQIYEPATAISVTDIVAGQGLKLILYRLNEKGKLVRRAAEMTVSLESSGGGLENTISVVIETIDDDESRRTLMTRTSSSSFMDTVWDWGRGPLLFSVGWAQSKCLLQVTIANVNELY
jgi:hypothetical protein